MSNKLPNEISDADLLELLNSKADHKYIVTSSLTNDDIVMFLSTFNIKPGKEPIQARGLYKLYKDWSKSPINQYSFAHTLNKYYKRQGLYYLINLDVLDLAKSALDIIKKPNKRKTVRKSWRIHFQSFVDRYSLKSGNFYVNDFILYYLYDKWTYDNRVRGRLGKEQFNEFCKLYFKLKRNRKKGSNWFGIDKGIELTHLPPAKIASLKEAKERHDRKKEKVQKKPN